jgi:hypothetical protein
MAYDLYAKKRDLEAQLAEAKKGVDSAYQDRKASTFLNPNYRTDDADLNARAQALKKQYAFGVPTGELQKRHQAAQAKYDELQRRVQDEDNRANTLKPFAELQEKQEMRAKEFRTAFPSILDSKLGHARTDMRRQIAEGVGNARAGYNQRGLLFSGMRAGAEADVGREAENKLADTAVQTQGELMDQASQLDQDAVDTGFTMGNISKDLAGTNEEYRKSVIDMLLKKDQDRQQAIGGLLGTGAQIAGYGLGAAAQ